jgi:hypothetical protein
MRADLQVVLNRLQKDDHCSTVEEVPRYCRRGQAKCISVTGG